MLLGRRCSWLRAERVVLVDALLLAWCVVIIVASINLQIVMTRSIPSPLLIKVNRAASFALLIYSTKKQ